MDSSDEDRAVAVLVVLSSQRSREDLLASVPLVPDRAWQKGDPRGRGSENEHRYSGFEIRSRLDRARPAHAHFADLVERIRPAFSSLRALSHELREEHAGAEPVRVWLQLQSGCDEAAMDLASDDLRTIGELGSRLGITVEFLHGPATRGHF